MTRREARLAYLRAHRDARLTGLRPEQAQVHRDIMRQLEAQHPGIHEQAIAGAPRHFSQPLSAGEREYQRHIQNEARLDNPQVAELRRNLDHADRPQQHGGRRRPVPPRPSQTRPTIRPAARRATRYVKSTAAAVAPPPLRGGGGTMLYGALIAGIGFSMLYLLLTRTGAATGVLNLFGGGFRRLTSPTTPFFSTAAPGASSSSGLTPATGINGYLQAPAPSPASVGAAASTFTLTPAQKAQIAKQPVMTFPGYHYDPAINQFVHN
jgi:hypothetical protein